MINAPTRIHEEEDGIKKDKKHHRRGCGKWAWLKIKLLPDNFYICREISQLSSVDEERLHGSLDST